MTFKRLMEKYRVLPIQVRASFWFLICAFLQKGITSITTPIFTRLLTTEEYGQFNVFNSWLGIVAIIVTLNLSNGVYMQGLIKFGDEKLEYSSSLQGLNLVLVLVWTAIYLATHNFWNRLFSLTTVQMLAMLVMIWTTAAFHFWSVEQRTELRYRQLVAVTLVVSLAKPIIGIVFVLHARDKVTARILGLMLVELIFYTGLGLSQMIRGKRFASKRFWKYALLFNLPLVPHYLSVVILSSSDRIMINKMVGSSEAGIYSLAYSVSQIMILFNTALNQTLSPWLYRKIKERKIQDLVSVAFPALVLIAVVNLMLIAFAPEVVAIFAPPAYHEAIGMIPPVTMSVYFMFMYYLFAGFEFYYEKTNYVMIATTVGAALNIVLNYIFIRIFGYYAAAYTTLVCYIVYAVCHYHFMMRICNTNLDGQIPYSPKILLSITGIFLGIGFVFLGVYKNAWLRYLIVVALLVLMLLMRKRIKEQVEHLLSVKKNKESLREE